MRHCLTLGYINFIFVDIGHINISIFPMTNLNVKVVLVMKNSHAYLFSSSIQMLILMLAILLTKYMLKLSGSYN